VEKLDVGGSQVYGEELRMETIDKKSTIETAATQSADSARGFKGNLRRLADGVADFSGRWARRCGEAVSNGAQLATLQANQRVLQTRLDRAYRELGRAVYAAHEKGDEAGDSPETPERQAALQRVKEAEAALASNAARLAELRKGEDRVASTSS
jgi:hypothetical protein